MKSAFDACPENDTCHLKQLERAQLPTKVTIPSNKTIIYDLNEKQVSTSEEMYFKNKGTLTIKNGTLSLEAVTNEDPIIYNEGTLNIETGATLTLGLSSAAKLIHNVNPGIVNVNAGSLVATTGAAGNDCDGRAIYNEGGYVEINGGTITGQACAPIANKIKLPEGYNNPGYDWSDGSTFSNDWYTTIPIDLSNYTGEVNINIDYDASYANGRFYIDENEDAPLNGEDPIKTNTEATFEGNIQKVAVGGKKYYLHFIGSALMVNTLDVSQGSNKEEIQELTFSVKNELTTLIIRTNFKFNSYEEYKEFDLAAFSKKTFPLIISLFSISLNWQSHEATKVSKSIPFISHLSSHKETLG